MKCCHKTQHTHTAGKTAAEERSLLSKLLGQLVHSQQAAQFRLDNGLQKRSQFEEGLEVSVFLTNDKLQATKTKASLF